MFTARVRVKDGYENCTGRLTGPTTFAVVAGLVVVATNGHNPLIDMRQLSRMLSFELQQWSIVVEKDMRIEKCLEECLVQLNPQSQQLSNCYLKPMEPMKAFENMAWRGSWVVTSLASWEDMQRRYCCCGRDPSTVAADVDEGTYVRNPYRQIGDFAHIPSSLEKVVSVLLALKSCCCCGRTARGRC